MQLNTSSTEGTADFRITWNGHQETHQTWYKIIRDWQVKDRLGGISVPPLLVSGRHDEAGLPLQQTLVQGLPTAEWTLFGDSSHMPHWEERDRYMEVVESWLRHHD
jgi:L-proline amide hydrolase